mmetsp:Transcript_29234/g.56475  ORF Transcript_29234/g.56475 Transcript_29234/m.56475 type:complete len:130 (-) Transcript_29234:702-1091(-)|eukprot:1232794-Pleurochrysis_carterae.AAC.1
MRALLLPALLMLTPCNALLHGPMLVVCRGSSHCQSGLPSYAGRASVPQCTADELPESASEVPLDLGLLKMKRLLTPEAARFEEYRARQRQMKEKARRNPLDALAEAADVKSAKSEVPLGDIILDGDDSI